MAHRILIALFVTQGYLFITAFATLLAQALWLDLFTPIKLTVVYLSN